MAAHIIGLQAGYSFASTIDPSTEADSAVLQVLTQLMAGIVFFALGLDRQVIRVLAESFTSVPLIAAARSASLMEAVIGLGSQVFLVGLRLAMPVMALLLLAELSFAILAKVHSQFHMQSLAFPSKMLTGLAVLAITLSSICTVWSKAATRTFEVLFRLLGK
jgi:flagellar biosynthesis protein FliR